MICALIGNIHALEPMRVELNVQDIIYEIAVSVQTSAKLRIFLESNAKSSTLYSTQTSDSSTHISTRDTHQSPKCTLLITHIIREDAQLLFGFVEALEKQTFERLLKINGVGAKVALTILSTFHAQQFLEIIAQKDIKLLQKVPGVGAKLAGKILLDLAGFCKEVLESSAKDSTRSTHATTPRDDITNALQSLGYKTNEIKAVLPRIDAQDTQEAIKQALRLLSQ